MQLIKYYFISIFFLGMLCSVQGSEKIDQLDSLKLIYANATSDTARITSALEIAECSSSAFSDAIYWSQKAISLTTKLNDQRLGDSYSLLANLYLQITKRDSAAFYFEKALAANLAVNNSKKAIENYDALATIYLDLGEYIKANDYYNQKLLLSQKLKDAFSIGASYRDLGHLYSFMGEYYLSIENYLKAQDVFKEANNLDEYNITLYYSALMYFEIGDYKNNEKLLKEALAFFRVWEPVNRSEEGFSYAAGIYKRLALLDIATENYEQGLVYCDSAFTLLKDGPSIGWVYAHRGEIYTKLNNFKKATENFDSSKVYIPECNQCYWPVYTNISEYFLHFGMLDSALYYCNKTLERSITYRLDIRILRTYNVLAQVYQAKGDYDKAFFYSQKYIEWYKQAWDKRKLAMLKNAENDYFTTKSNEEIRLLNEANLEYKYQSARQKLIIGFISVLILVVSILFYIVFKNQKQKQRLLEHERELSIIKSRIVGQDEERARIARELHDGVAADLSGIRIHLSSLPIYRDEPVIMNQIITQINQVGNEVRNISHNLTSPVFAETNLEEIIQSYIHQFRGKTHLTIELAIYPEINWTEVRTTIQKELYRIFQEVVNNTLKHANATQLSVQIVKHDSSINIIFEDNGKGFDNITTDGIGLKNIKERVQLLDGDIDILSVPSRGASVTIEIPLSGVKQHYSLS
jgi:signal transduction histidine kinase